MSRPVTLATASEEMPGSTPETISESAPGRGSRKSSEKRAEKTPTRAAARFSMIRRDTESDPPSGCKEPASAHLHSPKDRPPPKEPLKTGRQDSFVASYNAHKKRLPSSFMSSYRIHEVLVQNFSLPESLISDFNRWALCFLVIQFDVDIGPDLKLIRPALHFSEEEFRIICFSALPEHTPPYETCQFHTFRYDSKVVGSTVHGNCLFSQRRDISRLRGYLQEALVILSANQYAILWNQCLKILFSHEQFLSYSLDQKIPILDSAINGIATWPDPVYNESLELAFLGSVMQFIVPSNPATPLTADAFTNGCVDPWASFIPLFSDLSQLYLLYELVLLNRPLIVYSQYPHLCSGFILKLIDLIRPVPYNGRIREYVTIHSSYSSLEEGITGITNPLLLSGNSSAVYTFPLLAKEKEKDPGPPVPGGPPGMSSSGPDANYEIKNLIRQTNKTISRSRLFSPDSKFLNSLTSMDPSEIDHAIRFHFATLTSKLIAPLTIYFTPVGVRLLFNHYAFEKDLRGGGFKELDQLFFNAQSSPLLTTLTRLRGGPSKVSNSSVALFYTGFVTSANFVGWLDSNGVRS